MQKHSQWPYGLALAGLALSTGCALGPNPESAAI